MFICSLLTITIINHYSPTNITGGPYIVGYPIAKWEVLPLFPIINHYSTIIHQH